MQLLSVLILVVGLPLVSNASFLHGTRWERAAVAHGVDPALLYAVTIVESARRVDAARDIRTCRKCRLEYLYEPRSAYMRACLLCRGGN